MEGPEGQGNDFCLCEKKKRKEKKSLPPRRNGPLKRAKDPSSAAPPSRAGSREKLYNARPSVNPPLKDCVASIRSKRKSLRFVKKLREEKFPFNSEIPLYSVFERANCR